MRPQPKKVMALSLSPSRMLRRLSSPLIWIPRTELGRWLDPNERFVQRHVRLGHVHADPDLDGINRRIFTVKLAAGRAIRAFAVEALRGAGFKEQGDFDTSNGVREHHPSGNCEHPVCGRQQIRSGTFPHGRC